MGVPWHGRKRALTPTERQRRWRAKVKRESTGAEKRARRDVRIGVMLGRNARELARLRGMARIFNVIVIDPPWWFDVRSRLTGMDRSFENHYPPMTIAEIEAIGPDIPAAPDCVLALWATVPVLADAYRILKLWGFDYVTTITWNKRTRDMAKARRGLGYVARNVTEHLIIGKRGKPPWAVPGEQWDSSFDAPVVGHSVKPDEPYVFLAGQFAGCPMLEMYARRSRADFEVWGNETAEVESAA
jgi:N6-adenosine-specific RNA methylase IME4